MTTQPQLPAGYQLEPGQPKAFKKGYFGQIWLVRKDKDNFLYATKAEDRESKHQLLKDEYDLYINTLGTHRGIPKVFLFAPPTPTNPYNLMIMERLGPDLDYVFIKNGRKFSNKTIVQLAVQMFNLVEYVHSQKVAHGAVQPDNFCFANPNQPKTVGFNDGYGNHLLYLIDYSLSVKYIDPTTGQHIKERKGGRNSSSPRYTSINVQNGYTPGRRDDLESLGYCWAYFLAGATGLPWQNIDKDISGSTSEVVSSTTDPNEADPKQRKLALAKKIKEKKEATSPGTLFKLSQFRDFMVYVRKLAFETNPDYGYICRLLTEMYEKFQCDNVYSFQLN